MRAVTLFALMLTVPAAAAEPDRERRVRVALALSEPAAAGWCGHCRVDLDACRAESRATGRPVVLFVGGCDGRARDLLDAGAILCRAKEYASDDRPAAQKRVVVLSPKADRSGMVVWETFPADAPAAAVKAAVRDATPKAPAPRPAAAPLNWSI